MKLPSGRRRFGQLPTGFIDGELHRLRKLFLLLGVARATLDVSQLLCLGSHHFFHREFSLNRGLHGVKHGLISSIRLFQSAQVQGNIARIPERSPKRNLHPSSSSSARGQVFRVDAASLKIALILCFRTTSLGGIAPTCAVMAKDEEERFFESGEALKDAHGEPW